MLLMLWRGGATGWGGAGDLLPSDGRYRAETSLWSIDRKNTLSDAAANDVCG